MQKPIGVWMIFLIFGVAVPAFAGKGEIVFVETQVDLSSTGAAVVAYTV